MALLYLPEILIPKSLVLSHLLNFNLLSLSHHYIMCPSYYELEQLILYIMSIAIWTFSETTVYNVLRSKLPKNGLVETMDLECWVVTLKYCGNLRGLSLGFLEGKN